MQIQLSNPFLESDIPETYSALRPLGQLTVRDFRPRRPQTNWEEEWFARGGDWLAETRTTFEETGPLQVVLLELPWKLSAEVAYALKTKWLEVRGQAGGQYVSKALAFLVGGEAQRRDLTFVWSRAKHVEAPGERDLALITLVRRPAHDEKVVVEAPVKGRLAGLIETDLPFTPVVSSELLAARSSKQESIYVWSNRVAALRRMGLVIPLPHWHSKYEAAKIAHAEALGRPVDRRRTKLHRSVLHDLFWHLARR